MRGFIRLAEVDPLLDVAGVVATPQIGFFLVAQAPAEFQAIAGEQREGDQPHHQPLFRLRRMLGEG
jgi:hypothetical protein